MNKMLLVEKGKFVVVRDGEKEVGFTSFEDFNKHYPALDLTGKYYLDYEPDRHFLLDSESSTTWSGQVPVYDAVIAEIDNILAKRNDPYFGKDLAGVKKLRKQFIKGCCTAKIQEGCLTTSGVRYDCDDKDRSNMVAAIMTLQISGGADIVFIDYFNEPHTLSLIEMVAVGMQVGEYFQSQLYHKNALYNLIDAIPETSSAVDAVMAIDWDTEI